MSQTTRLKAQDILYSALRSRIGLLVQCTDPRAAAYLGRIKRELKDPALNELFVKLTRIGIVVYKQKAEVSQQRLLQAVQQRRDELGGAC